MFIAPVMFIVLSPKQTLSLSLSLSLSLKQYKHLAVFVRLIWLFGDNLSILTEEYFFIRRLMVINIHEYFFLNRKPKLRPHVIYMHCIFHAGWISVCFDQIKEVSKYCCFFFFFSFNLFINKIPLINSKYMY